MRLSETKKASGLSKTGIYEGMAEGTFPSQLKISKRSVGWKQSHIAEWQDLIENGKTWADRKVAA